MASQELINFALAGFWALTGWFVRVIWEAQKEMTKDLREIEAELHTKYMRRDEYRADIDEIKAILKEIFADLKKKADK